MDDVDEERLHEGDPGLLSAQHDAGREAGCDPDDDRCAPDEYVEDPDRSQAVPGTPDDVPYSLGEGRDAELWGAQQALIEEDVNNAYDLDVIPPEEVPDVLEAIGDDAAEANPELPEGTSATGAGSPLEPAHGGFPERQDD